MNLCRAGIRTHVHPETRDARNIGPVRIRFQAEHICIKPACLLQFLRFGSNADAVVVKFDDFDRHASQFTSPGTKHEILRMTDSFPYRFTP